MAKARNWRNSSEVAGLARHLGHSGSGDAVAFIVRYCMETVGRWIVEYQPTNLMEFLATVRTRTGLQIVEFTSTAELEAICERYIREGEKTFALVPREFEDETYGLTLRLERPVRGITHVSVIDCRGERAQRRWFSIWHEIAHVLADPQVEMAFRRCGEDEDDPVERVMDEVAGELAFHEAWYGQPSELTLTGLERHRNEKAPGSSRQSAFGAVIKRLPSAAAILVAKERLKVSEKKAAKQRDLFGVGPKKKLRVMAMLASPAARDAGLFIPTNMRIPEESVIKKVFDADAGDLERVTRTASENLGDWSASSGDRLPAMPIRVEAGRSGRMVFALLIPE